jgi:hypothetical protein
MSRRKRRNDARGESFGDRAFRREASRLERKGRRIDPTLEAYASFPGNAGIHRVARGLISRANVRWENVHRNLPMIAPIVLPSLGPLVHIDRGLLNLGASWHKPPIDFIGDWPDHLRWAADSAASAVRLLLLCQPVGVAAIVRQQLERWTSNLATTLGESPDTGEDAEAFFTRVWSVYPDLPGDPGEAYGTLSELLHGRGPLVEIVRWEALGLADSLSEDVIASITRLAKWIQLPLLQVFGAVLTSLDESHPHVAERMRQTRFPDRYALESKFVLPTLWPFTAMNLDSSALASAMDYGQRLVEGNLPGPEPDSAVLLSVFLQRRARAIDFARRGLQAEAELLGDDYDPVSVSKHEEILVKVAEMATLVSAWENPSPDQDALITAASAGRSALLLWLEDDDRAMTATRTVLECVAQARTWRLKPALGDRLDRREGKTRPRDWFDAAGWRRLSLVARSLGEFSHFRPGVRWTGARRSLAEAIKDDVPAGQEPIMRARGAIMNRTFLMLAAEVVARLRDLNGRVADVYETLIADTAGERPGEDLEEWLDRLWSLRDTDFGLPDFGPRPTP